MQNINQLAGLLSRFAALQGRAVPAHRFALPQDERGGDPLPFDDAAGSAVRMWQARFPQGRARELDPARAQRGDLPLLWCPRDGGAPLLLRGVSGAGSFVGEDAAGERRELERDAARHGVLLSLSGRDAQPGDADQPARSAADWFAFAIRQRRRIFLEAVFATFVLSAIGLVSAMYTMQVYDRVVPTKGFATLWVLTVGVLIAIALELTMKQVRTHMVDRACKAIDQELSSVFFGKALDIRMDARPKTVGTFASQIRHFESVRNFMTSSSLFILADAPFALLFIGVIAAIAGPVALVPVVMVPLSVLAGLAFAGPIERLTGAQMAESNRKNGLLIEAIDGAESVKAAAAEWKLLDRWRALTAELAGNELRLRALSSLATSLSQTVQQLSYVGLVAAGVYAIVTGRLTMGGLIACTIISGRALGPLAQIPGLIVQWKNAKIALKSLDAIMAMPGDRDDHSRLVVPERCEGRLRLEQAAFAYGGDKPILQVPALALNPGERVAVIGPVGSGKSTLIKLLSGLYKPTEGSVFLDGVDVQQLAPEFVREHVGYLPQDVRLFNGSLRENLTLGLPALGDSEILRAAALTGLDQVVQRHPRGLELEIAEGGRGLSGGQRQLVGLTRMLLMRPRVLLLDEPTASMDGQLEGRVMKHLFDEMPRESVLVIVTHKLGILPRVDRIVVIDGGRIAADGPRDQILALMRKPAPGPHAASASASASTPVPSPVSAPRAAAPAPALSSPPAAA